MTEHKDIQNLDDYTDKDYQKWEYLLLDPDTNRKELEEIVMTLAHLPTERAQEMLKKFEQSDRSDEVTWLEPAMEENEMWLLNPDTDPMTDVEALKTGSVLTSVLPLLKTVVESEIGKLIRLLGKHINRPSYL